MKNVSTKQLRSTGDSVAGFLLMGCAVLSLVLANTPLGETYLSFWNRSIGGHPLSHWIDDGLMAIFFLLVGLELKHEVMYGTLSSWRKALLPILAAVGGMVVPVLVYLCFNWGRPTQEGFGIPMATDIAFVLAVLALLGSRVPPALKVFLLALAVVDDLGAVLVIAIFYTAEINIIFLLLSIVLFALLFLLGHSSCSKDGRSILIVVCLYLVGGAGLWYFIMRSGVHATISGVLLAMTIPSCEGVDASPSHRLQQWLHKPVYLFVLPLFVLANTAIMMGGIVMTGFTLWQSLVTMFQQPHVLGIAVGLFFGKPLGIMMGVYVAIQYLGVDMPEGLSCSHFLAASMLGGVGFTMAIFITVLSFENAYFIDTAKVAILVSSLLAAIVGAALMSKK